MLTSRLKSASASLNLIYDTFTDTNGTAIASHVPNIKAVAGTYRTIQTFSTATNIRINSNRAGGISSSVTTAACVIETGQSNVIITCDVNKNNTIVNGGGTGVSFRASGSTGYFIDLLFLGTVPSIRLCKFDGTTVTVIQSLTLSALSITQTYALKVELQGSSIKTYVDNVLFHNTTDTTYSGTEHGFSVLTTSANKSWADNLLIIKN